MQEQDNGASPTPDSEGQPSPEQVEVGERIEDQSPGAEDGERAGLNQVQDSVIVGHMDNLLYNTLGTVFDALWDALDRLDLPFAEKNRVFSATFQSACHRHGTTEEAWSAELDRRVELAFGRFERR